MGSGITSTVPTIDAPCCGCRGSAIVPERGSTPPQKLIGWVRRSSGPEPVPGDARIFSWQRPWHPVHPALREACPYVVILVEFPEADGIRMVGNLIDPAEGEIPIGATVVPVYEDHDDGEPPFTLVQWRLAGS